MKKLERDVKLNQKKKKNVWPAQNENNPWLVHCLSLPGCFHYVRSTSFMYGKYSRTFIGGLVAKDETAGPLADLELGLEVRVWLWLN